MAADRTATLSDRRRAFRAACLRREAMVVPGAGNALTARVIEDAGFDAVYVTGAGVANTLLGAPDLGLVTLTELSETTRLIAEITDLPLIVDMDTGFGNALNAYRATRVIERSGASAIQIEDQEFPKKCGHFEGKAVIPLAEAVAKLKAVLDARDDPNLMVIARTDARSVDGFEAALERAEAFVEAGADMTFVEAPETEQEMRTIPKRLAVPQLANLVVGGKTPLLPQQALRDMGYSMVLYANAPLQAAMRGMAEVLGHLKTQGDLTGVIDRLADFGERQRLVDKAFYDAIDRRYSVG